MNTVMFESKIDDMACLKPSLMATLVDLPNANSSRTRSKIRMFASTDRPMVNTIPAIPGSVSTAPNAAKTPMIKNTLINNAMFATQPALL
ncbi:hypothetical protein D3C85_915000 [compost metagenome]